MKRILLLGHTGKMGIALENIFKNTYLIIGKSSVDFDAFDFAQVKNLIEEVNPDIVINAVAFLGIDPCELEPEKAFRLNTLYPKMLAELSNQKRYLLIHFSTDAVFNDIKQDYYIEHDIPHPLNIYGFTKYGGDCFIQTIAKRYYIFRTSVLFGETLKKTQFVEKMLQLGEKKKALRISDDIIVSPTYSKDVAKEIKKILESSLSFGLYHIANEGKASLYELIKEIIDGLNLDIKVGRCSYKDFPFIGRKNTHTPIKSEKVNSLRPWKDAISEWCDHIKNKL